MLVLERYLKQGVKIGDDVLIQVLEIRPVLGGKPAAVRLGIAAPDSTRIQKEEVWIEQQNPEFKKNATNET